MNAVLTEVAPIRADHVSITDGWRTDYIIKYETGAWAFEYGTFNILPHLFAGDHRLWAFIDRLVNDCGRLLLDITYLDLGN